MRTNNLIKTIGCTLIVCVSLWGGKLEAQNIGINTTGALPNSKSMLDIDVSGSTPKTGLLIPRMTTTERDAITAPIPESLLIYNTTNQCFEAWNQTAGVWASFGCVGCVIPTAPLANAGTAASTTGFTANWVSVAGATSYVLDVSTSSTFTSYVSGYNGLNMGNVLSGAVGSLTCATTYYYRVRATNACGTSANSNTISVVTSTCAAPTPTGSVVCGTQGWAASNLDVGTMISGASNQTNNSIIEKYCYNNLPANCTTYGGLYQWDEMMNYTSSINCDPCGSSGRQGLCPSGYHVPTDLEWSRYEYCLESALPPIGAVTLATFQTVQGWRGTYTANKLKVISGNTPAWDGYGSSGFAALPGGNRDSSGPFGALGTDAYYWTATEYSATEARNRDLYTGFAQSFRNHYLKNFGFSVRCIQD